MRIVFVTPEFITEEYFSGGLANYVHRVSQALVQQGHEIHVVTKSNHEEIIVYESVTVHKVSGKAKFYILFSILGKIAKFFNQLRPAFEQLTFSYRVYKKIQTLQKNTPIDLIQFPNSQACGLVSLMLFKKIPMVTRISCYRPLWNDLSGVDRDFSVKIQEWLEYQQLKHCPYIFSPSYLLKKILSKEANIHHVDVNRTPFFQEAPKVNYDKYTQYLEGKEYLLFFGRFQLHKGVHILAQALPQFLENFPEAAIVFAGKDMPSDLASSMKEYILSFCPPHENRFIFFDQLRHPELYPIIEHAKLVVLPSLIENIPNALLESMEFGKVVIGTCGTSFDEIITEGKNGFLVEKNNPKALSEKLIKTWQHSDLKQIGQAARKTVECFHPKIIIPQLEGYYQSIINDKEVQKIN